MDNTTKTKRHPLDKSYMAFRSDCPPEHARAAFERRHGCAPRRPDTGKTQGGALNRGDFTAYRRLVWLANHPDATAAELAQAFNQANLSEDAARKFLDGMARRRVINRRVVYRVRDDVRL